MLTKTISTKVSEQGSQARLEEVTIVYKCFGVTIYRKRLILPTIEEVSFLYKF